MSPTLARLPGKRKRPRTRRKAARVRPLLESLEDRRVPAVVVTESVLHPFADTVPQVGQTTMAADGQQPEGDVTLSNDGTTLYGRAFADGSAGDGTIFLLNTDGSNYETLHNYTGSATPPVDGSMPRHNAMALSPDGSQLYGMTVAGGTAGLGVVFRYDLTGPDANTFTVLHSWQGGTIDATTPSDGGGTIFAINVKNVSLPAPAAPTTVAVTRVDVKPGLSQETATITAQVSSPAGAVNAGTVTFTLDGRSAAAGVNGSGQATASVSLPALATGGKQTVTVSYSDAGAFAASTGSATAFFGPLDAFVPSTVAFPSGGGQTVTDTLFGLLAREKSFDAQGRLTEVSFDGVALETFRYDSQGRLVGASFAGVPFAVLLAILLT
jgi:uncharacterized repeat protein (TIGR03803 family)/YD repeat-containing protein